MDQEIRTITSVNRTESDICPPLFQKIKVSNLNFDNSFFDYFKEKYSDFDIWFHKKSTQNRNSWVYYKNNMIGALLIYKLENEPIDSNPSLPKKYRLKICTFKVADFITGNKIGELLIRYTIKLAIKENVSEIYLTHFVDPKDRLVKLISEYGFNKGPKKTNGESVFIKKFIAKEENLDQLSAIEVAKKFYPSFYDGRNIKKFLVPIIPKFHNRLFIDIPLEKYRQTKLVEYNISPNTEGENFIIEGNALKKAYLSNSNTKKMKAGDILLFYRSHDLQKITTLGIVESVYYNLNDPEEIYKLVRKMTVYKRDEIENMALRPTTVILFLQQLHFKNRPELHDLYSLGIHAPPSIIQINEDEYKIIKKIGDVDERFIID